MSVNIGPKIGVDGEAEYRRQINNIIQQAKTLNSEMKAVSSGFDKNASSQEKAAAAAKVLSKQVEVQKQRVAALEAMLSKSATALGENDTKTLRWQQAVNEANAELNRLEVELRSAESQMESTGDAVEDLSDEVNAGSDAFSDFGDILKGSFLADLAMDALREAGDLLKEFAAGSIEAAADVEASGARFEQAFGDMQEAAEKSLKRISNDTKVSTTRMQDSFADINAFAKSVGAESEDALDIASRAMIVAADSAAYYDKSVEEATESLQSFLKGNYENDAALGIAATETTRNAKANEMYATSFKNLSEAQKVDVLLAMVEAGNAASGALGQAAREADSWANVTGEATEALRQMQAVIGSGTIDLLIPMIQNVTSAIYEMIEATASGTLSDSMDDIVSSWEKAEDQFGETSKKIESNAIMAEHYAKRLSELEEAGVDTAESQREYANVVAYLNELYPDLNLKIDEQTGILDENSRAQLENLEAMKQKAIFEAQEEHYSAILRTQADAILSVQKAEYALIGIDGQLAAAKTQLAASTGLSADKMVSLYTSLMNTNFMLGENTELTISAADGANTYGAATRKLTADEIALIKQIISLQGEEVALNNEIEDANGVINEQEAALNELENAYGLTSQEAGSLAVAQEGLEGSTQDVNTAIQELQTEYANAREAARNSIDTQIGLFEELALKSDVSAGKIVANWGKQQEAFANYAANLEKAIDMGLDEVLVQQLADGSAESMVILDEFVNGTDVSIDEINDSFRKLEKSKDTAEKAMADVSFAVNEKLNSMISEGEKAGYDFGLGIARGMKKATPDVSKAAADLGKRGVSGYKEMVQISSPSKVMTDAGEDTGMGAVVGVENVIAEYEQVNERLALAGIKAFEINGYSETPVYIDNTGFVGGGSTTRNSYSFGDMSIQIYQQPGEDAEELAYKVMEVIQSEINKTEAGLGA